MALRAPGEPCDGRVAIHKTLLLRGPTGGNRSRQTNRRHGQDRENLSATYSGVCILYPLRVR